MGALAPTLGVMEQSAHPECGTLSQLLRLQLWVGWVLVPWALPVQSHPQNLDQRRQGERPKHQESEGARGSTGELTHTGRFVNSLLNPFRGRFKVLGPTMVWGNSRHFFKSDSEKSVRWYSPVLAFRMKCLAATKFTTSASGSQIRSSGTSRSGSDDVDLGVGTQSGG